MSSLNTTENGMWEREKQVCETGHKNRQNTVIDLNSPNVINAASYLPQFVSRRYGDLVPVLTDSCRLNIKFCPKSNIMKYRYTVSWFEDGPIHSPIVNLPLKKCKKKTEERGDPRLDCPRAKAKKKEKSEGLDTYKDSDGVTLIGPAPKKLVKKNSQEVSVELSKFTWGTLCRIRVYF